jgi:hypothetical protein
MYSCLIDIFIPNISAFPLFTIISVPMFNFILIEMNAAVLKKWIQSFTTNSVSINYLYYVANVN